MGSINRSPYKRLKKEEEDYISGLADGILALILCRLCSLSEIARTTVVCRRWRNMWKETIAVMPRLEFYGSAKMKAVLRGKGNRSSDDGMREFVNWVNGIINLHGAPTLDELKIHFPLSSNYSDDINGWIIFAVKKQVKKLHLNILPLFFVPKARPNFLVAKARHDDGMYNRLRDLCIKGINVSETVITGIFSNAPFLERLCVSNVNPRRRGGDGVGLGLEKLEIAASQAPNLKWLDICKCHNLQSLHISTPNLLHLVISSSVDSLKNIKISAPNLTSFTFCGVFHNPLVFTDVPAATLVHASIGVRCLPPTGIAHEDGTQLLLYNFQELLHHFSRVFKRLKLDIPALGFDDINRRINSSRQFPELGNLEHLEMQVQLLLKPYSPIFSWPCALVRAAPFLHTFSLTLSHGDVTLDDICSEWRVGNISKEVKGRKSHQYLKVVEVVGFTGCSNEIQLLLHLVEIAVSLEKIIIDVRYPWDDDYQSRIDVPKLSSGYYRFKNNPHVEYCRELAQRLKIQLGPGIDVVII